MQNIFEEGWQVLETLVGSQPNLAFNFRQTSSLNDQQIVRVKSIDLSTQSGSQTVLLTLSAQTDGRIEIRVQLYPLDQSSYLPASVKLALISTLGEVVQSVQAREQDECIQLKRFKCAPGKRFSIQVVLNDFRFTEAFVS